MRRFTVGILPSQAKRIGNNRTTMGTDRFDAAQQ
jgi:hypothetical protein